MEREALEDSDDEGGAGRALALETLADSDDEGHGASGGGLLGTTSLVPSAGAPPATTPMVLALPAPPAHVAPAVAPPARPAEPVASARAPAAVGAVPVRVTDAHTVVDGELCTWTEAHDRAILSRILAHGPTDAAFDALAADPSIGRTRRQVEGRYAFLLARLSGGTATG